MIRSTLPEALEARTTTLEPDHVCVWEGQFKSFLDGDDSLGFLQLTAQCRDQCRLPRLRCPGDEDGLSGSHRGGQQVACRGVKGFCSDQVIDRAQCSREFADVDRPVVSGDGWDDDVKSRPVRQRRVHERLRIVDSAAGPAEHPIDERPNLLGVQSQRESLVHTGASDEHRRIVIEPNLLYRVIVEERLQFPKTVHKPRNEDRIDLGRPRP